MSYTYLDDEDDFSNFTKSGASETSKSPSEAPAPSTKEKSEESEEELA